MLLVTFVGLSAFGEAKDDKKPSITIISVPTDPPGESMASEPIKGAVNGGDPKEYKVIIYARGGDKWWVQPTIASPFTDIGSDGKWESETHGGTEFAALLVKSSYKPEATLGTIPQVGGDILDAAKKKPEKKSDK
jgi:hypothetical protein